MAMVEEVPEWVVYNRVTVGLRRWQPREWCQTFLFLPRETLASENLVKLGFYVRAGSGLCFLKL